MQAQVTKLLYFFLGVFALIANAKNPSYKDFVQKLPEQKQLEFLAITTMSKKFLTDSPDVIKEKQSLYQFFNKEIYENLRGNYLLGYLYDEGFNFSGNTVTIDVVKTIPSTEKYKRAFKKALEFSATDNNILIRDCPYHLGVCIVGVEPKNTKSTLAGVMLEVYITNQKYKKTFFYRFGTGSKKGLEFAMLDASDTIFRIILNSRGKNE
jgi:hypothetical protein